MRKLHFLTPLIAVAALLLFTGFGCQQTDEALPQGEATTDLPTETLPTAETARDDLLAPAEGESFTVDLVPAEGETVEDGLTAADDTTTEAGALTDSTEDLTTGTTTDSSGLIATPVEEETTATKKTTDAEVLELSEKLAELHGTFTNKDKAPFQNYKNLSPYVTADMQKYLDGKRTGVTADPNATFFGRTTTALSSAMLAKKGTSATVLVTTKQEDISGTAAAPTTTYVLLRLEFVQQDGEWMLDGLYVVDPTKAVSS